MFADVAAVFPRDINFGDQVDLNSNSRIYNFGALPQDTQKRKGEIEKKKCREIRRRSQYSPLW